MIDSRIALGVQNPNVLGSIAQGQNIRHNNETQQRNNRLLDINIEGGEIQNQQQQGQVGDQEKSRELSSIAEGAVNTASFLENGDTQGLSDYLQQRRAEIVGRNGNPQDTDIALQLLNEGRIDELGQKAQQAISSAQQLGILKPPAAQKDTRTPQQKNFEAVNQNPEFGEFLSNQNKSKASNVNVVNEAQAQQKGLTKEQEALASSRVKRFETLQGSAQSALDQNEQLEQLKNTNVNTGFGEQSKVGLARVFNAFGVDGDALLGVDVVNSQTFNATAGRLLSEALSAQTGPQTDSDAKRISETLPNLTNESEANAFIVESMRAVNDRKVEQAEFYENILENDGTLKNADKLWREFKSKTPLVSATVFDKKTGRPMFFNSFKAQALGEYPSATEEQIIEWWREEQ